MDDATVDAAAAAARWRPAIEQRRLACRDIPGGYSLMVVPDMRTLLEPSAGSVWSGLEDLVVDPGPGLRARRQIDETFSRTGQGWTDYGAYCASLDVIEALRERIAVSPVSEPSLRFRSLPATGEPEPLRRLSHPGEDGYRRVAGRSDRAGGAVQAFQNRDAALPRMVAFAARGDAAEALARMLPFLCPRFSRVVAVTAPALFADLLESERPDAVLQVAAEAELAEAPHPIRRDFAIWSAWPLPVPAAAPALTIDFSAGGDARCRLGEGWSNPEPGHTWSVGPRSTLTVAEPPGDGPHEVALDVSPCLSPPRVVGQRLDVEANGTPIGSFRLTAPVRLRLLAPAPAPGGRALTLRFRHPDFVTPAALGWRHDDRPLAVCFKSLELTPSGYA